MNTGPDHQPLHEDEAALARRLRALPGGVPSPELDARIRARAHAAVAATRPRVRPWLWGVSTAAVAVLAVGMFWQLGLPPDRLQDATRSTPQSHEAARQAEAPAAQRFEQSGVDAAALRKADEPAAAAPAQSRARAPAAERMAEPVLLDAPAPVVILVPPPPPPAPPAPEPQLRSVPQQPAPASTEADVADEPVFREPEARPAQPASPPRALRRPPGAGAAAAPADAARAAAIQAWADGAAADWLVHIEALLRDGRTDDARAHLRAFRERHPDHPLPPGLARLL